MSTSMVIGGVILLIVGLIIFGFVLNKISVRFCLMPSTDALLRVIACFIVILYLFPYFDSSLGLIIGIGLFMLTDLFKFITLSKIEKKVSNNYSLEHILELCNKKQNGADDIAEYLNLKNRNDYDEIIPQIIENLKNRNKLPHNLIVRG